MSNLNPTAPSQPTLDQSYETPGNPVDTEPAERFQATRNAGASETARPGDQRIPTKQSNGIQDATPSSLGYGVHGAPPGEESRGFSQSQLDRNQELEGEQMRASGEGDVADTVQAKPGAVGSQADFSSDLDRKKAEQAPLRDAISSEREQNINVGGILSNRGGPANPVDKGNYPNA